MMSQQGGNSSSRGTRNPAQNLSAEDRRKGGEHSAKVQQRDEFGQFAGRKDETGAKGSHRAKPEEPSGGAARQGQEGAESE